MLKRIFVLFITLSLFLSSPVLAIKVNKVEIEATHILVGKVKKVESYYGVNDWGDVLILSQVKVKVERKVKGKMEDSVSFVVEGGTVGDMTLKVSEYPLFTEGEQTKLYLKKINYFFHFIKSEKLEAARARGGKPDKKPKGDSEKCCKTFAHWPDSNVPYYINTDNDDIRNPNCVNGDIIAGAIAWNSESNINLTYAGTTGTKEVHQNFTNEIFFRDAKSGSTIAATYVWYYRKGRRIIEFDMVFYDGAWKFSGLTSQCQDSCDGGFYVQTIGIHELGHAIGIDHNRCKTSIMYPYAGFCDQNTVLSDDDKACASNLYK